MLLAALLLTIDVFVVHPAPIVTRRAFVTSISATSLAAEAPPVTTQCAFAHSTTTVDVDGCSIPVAMWKPTPFGAAAPPPYPYCINIGKIAAKLRVGWLGWLPSQNFPLVGGGDTGMTPTGFASAPPNSYVLFAHGFLGSVYDLAHVAEALASDGFTVVAPELPESLTAGFMPPEGLGREEIIAATRQLVDPAGKGRWGIFGHSAGAGSALQQRGDYVLGRACLAAGFRGYNGRDPVFLCASDGDGCNAFMGGSLRTSIAADGRFVSFDSLNEAYATPKDPPALASFIFAEDNSPAPLPCHISFLWGQVDEAMAQVLSPFLPLAKALGLFLLDFDVYLETRDADTTAAKVVPAMRRFFLANAASRS